MPHHLITALLITPSPYPPGGPVSRTPRMLYPIRMADPDPPLRKAGAYLDLVYVFPATILLPALGGWWLDKKLHTDPWFVLLGLGLGIAAAFGYLFKTLSVFKKKKVP